MTNLKKLDLSNNNITDISPLAKLYNLEELNLSRNNIEDIGVLADKTNLVHLDLSSNPFLPDFSPLQELTKLEYLAICPLSVPELDSLKQSLAKLCNLRDLTFEGSLERRPLDLAVIGHLTKLERLIIQGYGLTDLSPLVALADLRELLIYSDNIEDISPLADLTHLEVLFLSNNNIRDITPLAKMTSLRHVALAQNPIEDISVLAELPNLEYALVSAEYVNDEAYEIAKQINKRRALRGLTVHFIRTFGPK